MPIEERDVLNSNAIVLVGILLLASIGIQTSGEFSSVALRTSFISAGLFASSSLLLILVPIAKTVTRSETSPHEEVLASKVIKVIHYVAYLLTGVGYASIFASVIQLSISFP